MSELIKDNKVTYKSIPFFDLNCNANFWIIVGNF